MGRPATLKVDIITDARKASSGITQTESKLGRLGGIAKKAGKAAAVGIGAIAVGAAAAGKAVLSSASRQQQAFGALDSIFGKNAKQVKRWAKGAADSVGLAASEYGELASVVGAQLQGMGYATDKSAKKSKTLIKTGADLAATFGGSVSDAVGAVSSLLKGERDPIERYGVSIKQADVNARLAAMGLDGLTGKAAKQAQAQATLSLLNEQTAKTTGAFARESNTLAGQQERLKAKFENVKASIGKKLLPVAVKLFSWFSNKLLPGATRLGRYLAQRFGPAFSRVGEFVTRRLVPALRDVYRWFMREIYPGIRRFVTPILRGVQSAFGSVSSAVRKNSGTLRSLGRIFSIFWRITQPIRNLLGPVIGGAFRVLGGSISFVINALSRLIGWIDAALSKLNWLADRVSSIDFNPFSGGDLWGAVGGLVGRSPGYAPGGRLAGFSWTEAATGGASTADLLRQAAGDVTRVDARDYSTTIRVDGALDPDAVARQIETLLARRSRRLGRAA